MSSAKPILRSYRDGDIDFDTLVARLVAFEWKAPTDDNDDPWGMADVGPLGEEGTHEEIDAACDAGWLTQAQRDAIFAALR